MTIILNRFKNWLKKEIKKTLEDLINGLDGWNEPFYK